MEEFLWSADRQRLSNLQNMCLQIVKKIWNNVKLWRIGICHHLQYILSLYIKICLTICSQSFLKILQILCHGNKLHVFRKQLQHNQTKIPQRTSRTGASLVSSVGEWEAIRHTARMQSDLWSFAVWLPILSLPNFLSVFTALLSNNNRIKCPKNYFKTRRPRTVE